MITTINTIVVTVVATSNIVLHALKYYVMPKMV